MKTVKCSCGCGGGCGCGCDFNPCAVTCGACLNSAREYGCFYNITEQTVAEDAAVTFSDNGIFTNGVEHAAGTSQITIQTAGVYLLSYYIGNDDTRFTVFVNGVPVAGSTYESGDAINGQVIISVKRGDVITLVNTSQSTATLDDSEYSPAVVNASISLLRIF